VRLNAHHLTIERGGRVILRDLSFGAAAGEALVLTGRNGAGKTTLLRAIAGFLRPVSGSVLLDGGDPELSVGEQCHWIGHLNAVKGALTTVENLRFWVALAGDRAVGQGHALDSRAVDAALARFDLAPLANIPARVLSAGQTRRLALARLVLLSRPIWLLDEPTVSLDAVSQRMLAEVIDAHTAGGGVAIAATHFPLGLADVRELALMPAAEAA
jgi:heme exporter protein A